MIVCPVCEHPQADGAECEVCGKRLRPAGASIAAPTPLDGLEPTALPAASAPPARLPDLECTGHAAVAEVPDRTPDVERTALPAAEVALVPAPGIERSGADPAEGRTPPPAVVTCRYCRTPALPGERLCGQCGMRLPSYGSAVAEDEDDRRRCPCGAVVTGPRCPACGARSA